MNRISFVAFAVFALAVSATGCFATTNGAKNPDTGLTAENPSLPYEWEILEVKWDDHHGRFRFLAAPVGRKPPKCAHSWSPDLDDTDAEALYTLFSVDTVSQLVGKKFRSAHNATGELDMAFGVGARDILGRAWRRMGPYPWLKWIPQQDAEVE
ncbi:MAG: hypothetical protein AAB932_03715 [Patescibacteria group bacterium]